MKSDDETDPQARPVGQMDEATFVRLMDRIGRLTAALWDEVRRPVPVRQPEAQRAHKALMAEVMALFEELRGCLPQTRLTEEQRRVLTEHAQDPLLARRTDAVVQTLRELPEDVPLPFDRRQVLHDLLQDQRAAQRSEALSLAIKGMSEPVGILQLRSMVELREMCAAVYRTAREHPEAQAALPPWPEEWGPTP